MYETVIVGAGPGGTGPLIWAAQHGHLPDWLSSGVALIDQAPSIGGSLHRYTIGSDSPGRSYLECFDHPAFVDLFGALYREDTTKRLYEHYETLPPLPLVGAFLQRQGVHLERLIAKFPASRFFPGSRAQRLRLQGDGRIAVGLGGGHPAGEITGAAAIMALGGRQVTETRLCGRLDLCQLVRDGHLYGSDEILAGDGLDRALARVGALRSVVVLGASHSAFSVAWRVLEAAGDTLAPGAVNVLYRTEPRIFYPTREAADDDLYPFVEDDICPATQRVNRLSGLRGDGRELWRRIHAKPGTEPEHRVVCRQLDQDDLADARLVEQLRRADLVVTTFGYRSRTLPIVDAAGRELACAPDPTNASVDQEGRLWLEGGRTIPNLFGIGLGTGYRPSGRMGGEPSLRLQQNSLWLYQNDVGEVVCRAARRAAAAHRPAVGALGKAFTLAMGGARTEVAQPAVSG